MGHVTHRPTLIISGGQTGADRAGLDVAIELGIQRDGWCPKFRRAEDGRIPDRYNMRETTSAGYEERTLLNVKWADATLICSVGSRLSTGSLLTRRLCEKHEKIWCHFRPELDTVEELRDWMNWRRPLVLNIAGQRESKSPGIGDRVREILRAVWA